MSLRISVAQLDPTVGAFTQNSALIFAAAEQAAKSNAQVLLLPMGALSGYPLQALQDYGYIAKQLQHTAAELATRLQTTGFGDLQVVLSMSVSMPSLAVISKGQVQALPVNDFGVARLDVSGLACGVVLGSNFLADGGYPAVVKKAGLAALLVMEATAFVAPGVKVPGFNPAAPTPVSALEETSTYRETAFSEFAKLAQTPVIAANLVGAQDELVFAGQSRAVNANGTVVAEAPRFQSAQLSLQLQSAGLTAGPTTVNELSPQGNFSQLMALRPAEQAGVLYQACVLSLHTYITKNGFQKVTLGLSGGIDSALVAAMAADAMINPGIIGVAMPSPYSSEHSLADAQLTAEINNIDYRVIPIASLLNTFEKLMPVTGVAAENLQARMRGMILMAISNMEGALVLATGNKSELSVGYSTIYGDAVGGFAPLKDIPKTLVWEMSRWRNNLALDQGQIPPIPESSITKPPSAELRPGQQDTDSLPAYAQLDAILEAYLGGRLGQAEIIDQGFPADNVQQVLHLVKRAEWKRRQYPLGPKVSTSSWGSDLLMPVTDGRK